MQQNVVVMETGKSRSREFREEVLEKRQVGHGRYRGMLTKSRIYRAGPPTKDAAKLLQGGGRQQ